MTLELMPANAHRKKVKVGVFVYPQAQILDITGPTAILSAANDSLPSDKGYEISLIGLENGRVAMNSPIELFVDRIIDDADLYEFDVLVVPGGMPGTMNILRSETLLDLLRDFAASQRRIVSICTGAFILAEAGLLDSRRCTTHWKYLDELQQRYPKTRVLRDVLYHEEDNVWTSAGITAGMDMALAMVATDYGIGVSQKVAQNFVMHLIRPGAQTQVSQHLLYPLSRSERFRDLVQYVQSNPQAVLSVDSLAAKCGMSPRNFTRRFSEDFGITPAKMVESIRVSLAEEMLRSGQANLQRTATHCGFTSVGQMRAAFLRWLNITPKRYVSQCESQALAS